MGKAVGDKLGSYKTVGEQLATHGTGWGGTDPQGSDCV